MGNIDPEVGCAATGLDGQSRLSKLEAESNSRLLALDERQTRLCTLTQFCLTLLV